jgi:hypothetical protein
MGLFGRKKEESSELPPLQFPELPKSVPSFEPQSGFGTEDAEQIKSAISMPSQPKPMPGSYNEEKPLFVKIEKYRDVVETLKKLKARLNEADSILNKLTSLREEEDRELTIWQGDLEKIRSQLMEIDRNLFE